MIGTFINDDSLSIFFSKGMLPQPTQVCMGLEKQIPWDNVERAT